MKIAGIFGPNLPFELVHAAGFLPCYQLPDPPPQETPSQAAPSQELHLPERHLPDRSASHLPGFSCRPVRQLVSRAVSAGKAPDIMLFSAGCDAVQVVSDIWKSSFPEIPSHLFRIPIGRSDGALDYLKSEITALWEFLGFPDPGKIRESVKLYNNIRRGLENLTQPDTGGRGIDPLWWYSIFQDALTLGPEQLLPRLDAELERKEGGELDREGPPILIIGSHLGSFSLFKLLGQAGFTIAGDLLDLGMRRYRLPVDEESEPIEALAKHLWALPSASSSHAQESRSELLIAEFERSGAEGIILARQKYCDPLGFDKIILAEVIRDRKIPFLEVELEEEDSGGALLTRLEAFREVMEG